MRPRPPHPVRHPMPGKDTTPMLQPPAGDSQAQDRAAIDQLLRDTKALAHTGGCASADQCAVLPIGARACGGPEDYVVYCPRTTDVAALERKASELDSAEKAFNAKYHIVSTCILKEPPRVTRAGGSCRAAPATPPAR
jgi:hypothetical protein